MEEHFSETRLRELEAKWLNGTITPEEAAEYARWYNHQQDKPVEIPETFAPDQAELEARMLAGIRERAGLQQQESEDPHQPVTRRIPVIRWVAAASVLLLAAAGGYWWLNGNNNATGSAAGMEAKTDAAPGFDRAQLQLADGRTILLDSAGSGQLAVQGTANVLKGSGELQYVTGNNIPGNTSVLYNTMTTPRGGQYRLVLADGTRVWLNSASQLRFPAQFAGGERRVELSGEAYFEVARDQQRPFYLVAGDMKVQVLGTHFNVNAYPNESVSHTTLLEGSVQVSQTEAGNALRLQPGEQARLQPDQNRIGLVRDVDVDQVIAWQQGLFEFRHADLGLIARQLSRWYDVDVTVAGKDGNIQLGGGISKRLRLTEVLELLGASGVRSSWENGKVILSTQ